MITTLRRHDVGLRQTLIFNEYNWQHSNNAANLPQIKRAHAMLVKWTFLLRCIGFYESKRDFSGCCTSPDKNVGFGRFSEVGLKKRCYYDA